MMPHVRGHWGVSFPGDHPAPQQKYTDLEHLRQSIFKEDIPDPDDDQALMTLKSLPASMGVADYTVRVIAAGVNQTALDFGLDVLDDEWRCPVNVQITPSNWGGARQRSEYGQAIHNQNSATMRALKSGKSGSPRADAPSEVPPVQKAKAKFTPLDQRQIIVEAKPAAQKATSVAREYVPKQGSPWANMDIAPPPEPGSTNPSPVMQRVQAAAAKAGQQPPRMSPPPKATMTTVSSLCLEMPAIAKGPKSSSVVTSRSSAPLPGVPSHIAKTVGTPVPATADTPRTPRGASKSPGPPKPPGTPPPTRLMQDNTAASSSERVVTSGQDAAPKGKNPSRAKTPSQAGTPWKSSAVREHRSRSNRAQRENDDQSEDQGWHDRGWNNQGWNSRYGRWWESNSSWSSRRSGPW